MDLTGSHRSYQSADTSVWACPYCFSDLVESDHYLICSKEKRTFGRILGFPDLRTQVPAEDTEWRLEAEKLARLARTASFRDLLAAHYKSRQIPKKLVERYLLHAETGVIRSRFVLQEIERRLDGRLNGTLLELGFGTGFMLQAAAEKFDRVLGIEIAPYWLPLAGKRLAESRRTAALACASAYCIPLPEASVDVIVALDVLEHLSDPLTMLNEAFRVLKPGGVLFMSTPNRFTPGLEPHVRLWGVGLLPRRLQLVYVRWRRGVDYTDVRTKSLFALSKLLRASLFKSWEICVPDLPLEHVERLSRVERLGYVCYSRTKKLPFIRWFWLCFSPLFSIYCRK